MLTLFRRDLTMHQMRRKQSLAWRNWSGRTIQSNKHWAVAVIVPAVRFGGSNQKPNLNIDLANTKRGQYQKKKKEIQRKRSSCSSENCDNFFILRDKTKVGLG